MDLALRLVGVGLHLKDTWRTLGLRGAGSHDIVLDGVFVPDAAIGLRSPAGRWGPACHVVVMHALPLIYAVSAGVAQAAELSRSARRRDDATTRPPRSWPAAWRTSWPPRGWGCAR